MILACIVAFVCGTIFGISTLALVSAIRNDENE